MVRILYVENGTSGGGSFESLTGLVEALDRTRYDPVVAFVNATSHVERLRAMGVPVHILRDPVYSRAVPSWQRSVWGHGTVFVERVFPRVTAAYDQFAHRPSVRALAAMIARERIGLLHVNNQSVRDCYAIALAGRLGIPCVSHLRSVRVRAVTTGHLALFHRSVTRFIANSRAARDAWVQFGIDADRIRVIPNGIPMTTITPVDIRARWGIPRDRAIIGCVGNLVAGKGHAFLLTALAQLIARMPMCHAVIVGDGPLRVSLEHTARTLGIARAVTFAGYCPDAKAMIASMDCLVLPSETETFGRTLLEAMLAHTPIVATNVGGVPEVVTDGYDGILVSPSDAGACAAAMARVLGDTGCARKLTDAGAKTVLRFSMDRHVREVTSVYDEMRA